MCTLTTDCSSLHKKKYRLRLHCPIIEAAARRRARPKPRSQIGWRCQMPVARSHCHLSSARLTATGGLPPWRGMAWPKWREPEAENGEGAAAGGSGGIKTMARGTKHIHVAHATISRRGFPHVACATISMWGFPLVVMECGPRGGGNGDRSGEGAGRRREGLQGTLQLRCWRGGWDMWRFSREREPPHLPATIRHAVSIACNRAPH